MSPSINHDIFNNQIPMLVKQIIESNRSTNTSSHSSTLVSSHTRNITCSSALHACRCHSMRPQSFQLINRRRHSVQTLIDLALIWLSCHVTLTLRVTLTNESELFTLPYQVLSLHAWQAIQHKYIKKAIIIEIRHH